MYRSRGIFLGKSFNRSRRRSEDLGRDRLRAGADLFGRDRAADPSRGAPRPRLAMAAGCLHCSDGSPHPAAAGRGVLGARRSVLPGAGARRPAAARGAARRRPSHCPGAVRHRGIARKKDRSGILIFVSLAEHYARIVADEGIAARVPQAEWQGAVDALVAHCSNGRIAEGFICAIDTCGAVLANHFPRTAGSRDELPDRIYVI
jgi:hypothetical protein